MRVHVRARQRARRSSPPPTRLEVGAGAEASPAPVARRPARGVGVEGTEHLGQTARGGGIDGIARMRPVRVTVHTGPSMATRTVSIAIPPAIRRLARARRAASAAGLASAHDVGRAPVASSCLRRRRTPSASTRRASRGAAPRRGREALADGRAQVVDAQVDRAELAEAAQPLGDGSSMWRAPIAAITASPAIASRVALITPPCRRWWRVVADQLGPHRRGGRDALAASVSMRRPSTWLKGMRSSNIVASGRRRTRARKRLQRRPASRCALTVPAGAPPAPS